MNTAELVLEYVKALAWPVVIGGAILLFRKQIAAKIKDLRGVSTPLGDATFDGEAKALEAKTERAAAHQEAITAITATTEREATKTADSEAATEARAELSDEALVRALQSPQPSDTDWEREQRRFLAVSAAVAVLNEGPDFTTARDVATASPNSAVMVAYAELERVLRAAWTATQMSAAEPPANLGTLVRSLSPTDDRAEFVEIAREIAELRNRVVHGAGDVTVLGALDFIAACERMAEVQSSKARSKLLHPSRSALYAGWIRRHSGTGTSSD
jgi:hypothetical protein